MTEGNPDGHMTARALRIGPATHIATGYQGLPTKEPPRGFVCLKGCGFYFYCLISFMKM
jgi:hypothetical protein